MSNKLSSLIVLAATSIALTFGFAGCNKTNIAENGAQSQPAQTDQSQDPAATANLAPTDGTQATGTDYQQQPVSQAPQQNYQQPAPAQQQAPQSQNYSNNDYDADYQATSYNQPVLQARQPPPPLPEYSQPPCPGDGYLWTPGYWSYSPQGYYWVPGAWAWPPQVGVLWTPGYWGLFGGMYRYNYGFWGQYVGYYGGINYGFGYGGTGYQGGYWRGNRFNYNRSVNNVNITNVNVYNRTINNTTMNRASYNGPGGVTRQPLQAENAALRQQRIPPMTTQLQNQRAAAQNRQQFASVNQGRPAVLAATRPIPAGRPIAPVIPARTAAQPRPQPQQQQRAQAQPQQHAQPQPQQRAQAQPQRPAAEEKNK
jgi:WXXGXW repeat (2 copies)